MRVTLIPFTCLVLAASAAPQSFENESRRFANAYMPHNPKGTLEVRIDHNGLTPSGPYLVVSVVRQSEDEKSGEALSLLVDPQRRTVAAGLIAALPPSAGPVTPEGLPRFAQEVLPQMLGEMLGARLRVKWPAVPAKPSGVIQIAAELSTGYGWSKWPISMSADAKYIVLGATWPLDRDPRAVRREILDSPLVQWDPGNEQAILRYIEFSDYECPACKRAWGEVKPVIAQLGKDVRHGMINYPLVRNHPWAFRAAVGGSCVASLWHDKLLAFKDEMYRLQDTLTVETVDEAVFGFLTQHSLNENSFRACYLKDPAVDRVLAQLELGQRLGILGTPSYFVNGEHLGYGDKTLLTTRLQAILAAGGIPEKVLQ
jgi:hypothetical protein